MGNSESLSVKKDFNGKININGIETTCALYQAGGELSLRGIAIEAQHVSKIMEAIAGAKLDVNPDEWVLSKKERDGVLFLKK